MEKFAEAAQRWDLERLYADLAEAKKVWAPYKRTGLTNTEREHLRGLLCGYSPREIAQRLHKQPNTVEEALSETLYRYVETAIARPENSLNHWREILSWLETAGYKKTSRSAKTYRVDWGDAPDISLFCDRASELALLQKWILEENCRVVAILGMGGIGKTALAVKLARAVVDRFDYSIWRSLRYAPPFLETLQDILEFLLFSDRTVSDIAQLIRVFQERRCLLVIDGVENVLAAGELAGEYHRDRQEYRELIRWFAESYHQSCLVLTSQEKTREIAAIAGTTSPVRTLKLTGLSAAKELLVQKGLSEQENWEPLIELYQGNPLALKIVATTIQDVFGGSVDEFLRHSSIFLGDFEEILQQHFQRLSWLEKEILYGLFLEGKPVSIYEWRESLWSNLSITEFVRAIESLVRRSLLELNRAGSRIHYGLQPVVSHYVKTQFIEQICREILRANRTQIVNQNSLLKSRLLLQFRQGLNDVNKVMNYRILQVKIEKKLRIRLEDTHPDTWEEELNKLLSFVPQLSLQG